VDCYHHSSDWENNEGVIRQADALGMGIILLQSQKELATFTL
jgi:hypothetical protein